LYINHQKPLNFNTEGLLTGPIKLNNLIHIPDPKLEKDNPIYTKISKYQSNNTIIPNQKPKVKLKILDKLHLWRKLISRHDCI
jgi:hypothetical protein